MLKKIVILFVIATVVYACSKSDTGPDVPVDEFDRTAMLTHLADNIIIPSLEAFKGNSLELKNAAQTFSESPNTSNLESLRSIWYTAYKAWQHVEMFNIGKAEELQFVNFINVYPVTESDIEANVSSGTYDLNHPNNHDAQGFAALDYMIHGIASDDASIIAKFTTDAKAANYKAYLTDVASKIDDITGEVVNDWNGTYRDSFISNAGNSATSSLNKLVNDFIYYYEKGLRANKVGIPAGNFSATPLPAKVEAYYKRTISKELLVEALSAVEDFFKGKSYNSSAQGTGFKGYLSSLNRDDLVTQIETQLGVAKAQINSLDANFYTQITTNNTEMTKAYDELQRVVVMFKVDMLQAFSVSVDYIDADGD